MVTGIVLLSVGGVATILTAVTLRLELDEQEKCDSSSGCINGGEIDDLVIAKGVALVISATAAAVGIGLTAYGAPRVKKPPVAVDLRIGPAWVGLQLRY